VPLTLDALPAALVAHPPWGTWRSGAGRPGGTRAKVPHDPRTRRFARVNDLTMWVPFADARAAYERGAYDGVGLLLTGNDLIGADLDHCRNPLTCAIAPWAQVIVDALRSYTEVTPSGTGLRIFARGRLPCDGCRPRRGLELYQARRFLTVTGWHLAGTPTTIEARPAELAALHTRVFSDTVARVVDTGGGWPDARCENALPPAPALPTTPVPTTSPSAGETLENVDWALVARAFGARNGRKFAWLWAGRWASLGYPSPSEADLALCRLLAYWTDGDTARMDRLFRASVRMRRKWDERRGAQTYGQLTIARAAGREG
jgi:primase-polymerase (primpol)-like protein